MTIKCFLYQYYNPRKFWQNRRPQSCGFSLSEKYVKCRMDIRNIVVYLRFTMLFQPTEYAGG